MLRLVVCSALFLLSLSGPLAAQEESEAAAPNPANDLRGFWNTDDARDWTRAVRPNSSREVVYHDYPVMLDKVKEDTKAEEARRAAEAKIPVIKEDLSQGGKPAKSPENSEFSPKEDPQKQEPNQPRVSATPLSREQILAKFGSPDEPQVIRAQKDAPPAMQGLFEALNSNDKQLAFQYAMALARRQVEMQKMVGKATDYQILAMEAIGIRPANPMPDDGEPIDPSLAEVKEYYQEARQKELKKLAPGVDVNLEQYEVDSSKKPARENVRQAIPADPNGNVKILIFLDETNAEAAKIAERIKPLRNRYAGDAKFALFGLTKRTYELSGLKKRAAEISFPFPLVSGEALALDLRIRGYPTTVFVAASTKETYRVDGVPSVEEMDKTIRIMRGGQQ
jgi:hypothetical protein